MTISRRGFMGAGAAFFAAAGASAATEMKEEIIQGFDEIDPGKLQDKPWEPFSDRKVRVGVAGYGFGIKFAYEVHPNVEMVAVAELDPKKLLKFQKHMHAPKTYSSCEEMIKNASADKLEAVYIATDAPSHARLAIMALEHGLHVVSACPVLFGADQLELVPKLVDAVKASGKLYMMNETSAYRPECYAMRKIFEAGGFGKHVFTEGEYFHYWGEKGLGSYNGWRRGLPPQYYPTHSNAFYTCVTHGAFTEVSCMGIKSDLPDFKDGANRYKNPFGSEVALFKTSDGGASRMAVVWGAPGFSAEAGRFHGEFGSFGSIPLKAGRTQNTLGYRGLKGDLVEKLEIRKPRLPRGVYAGGHGGSHGYLTDDFLRGILVPGHKVCVDLKTSLDTTVAGIYAHLSAMKDGETLKIPATV